MGILLSRFRRKPNTKERLESIEKELDEIDDFKFYTQQQQKWMIGSLMIYSVIVYIIAALVFYFYYFPSELSKQLLYSLPLIVFPVIIWIIKQLLHWYYRYKLVQNEDKILVLQREKKKLLKEVMEKETYKIAKEILEKYDPEQMQKKWFALESPVKYNAPDILSRLPETEVRRRASTGSKGPISSQPQSVLAPLPVPKLTPPQATFRPPVVRPGYNAPPLTNPRAPAIRPSGNPMPYPILPRQRGLMDKLVEYVVGDGPNNRYALICRHCHSHNGMALREEFEFISFRCCYCYHFNPARKLRPLAPRLSLPPLSQGGRQMDKNEFLEDDDSKSEGTPESVDDVKESTDSVSDKQEQNVPTETLTIEELSSDGSEDVKDSSSKQESCRASDEDKHQSVVKQDVSTDIPDGMHVTETGRTYESMEPAEVSQTEPSLINSTIDEISLLDGISDSSGMQGTSLTTQ